jgi:hypothetical protein
MRLLSVSYDPPVGGGNSLGEGARSEGKVSDATCDFSGNLRSIEVTLFVVFIRSNGRVGIELCETISAFII